MAAITTAAAGAWSSTTTWTGGVVPGAGDTVTLNHAVSLTDARTVGASPAAGSGTKAILCNSTLTITGTGALTCRGDIGLNTGGLVMQAGSVLEFDAHLAASPSTALYICGATNFNAGTGLVSIAGTSGTHCTVRSNTGGANGRFTNPDEAGMVADWCDFQRIGDSTHPAFNGGPGNGHTIHFGNCTFDSSCGPIGNATGSTAQPSAVVELINVTHSGSSSVGLAASTFSGGTRTISGCRFAGDVKLYGCDGYNISANLFEGTVFDVTFSAGWTSVSDNLFSIPSGSGDLPAAGPMLNNYVLRPGTPINQHGFTTVDVTGTLDGFIFDMPDGTDGAGDCITFNNPSTARTILVQNCIVLPNGGGNQTGTLTSCLGGANTALQAIHNTMFSPGGADAVYVGETYAGHAQLLDQCHSNIAWATGANSALIISAEVGTVQDIVLSGHAHHNGIYNKSGTGYSSNLSFSSGSPGANDIAGNPNFVDSTRNIKTWDASLGGPGTVANALTAIRTKTRTIRSLVSYVRAGFVVQNTSMRTGAADGTVMGAVQDPIPPAVFTLTGEATSFLYTHKLAAAVATFAATGAAKLLADRSLVVANGAFPMVGEAVTMTKGRLLTADTGVFPEVGEPASMSYHRQIAAAVASLALTGEAAAVLRIRSLPALGATFGGTGLATLYFDHKLGASFGAFPMIGEPAVLNLSASLILLASGGVFGLTGFATKFLQVHRVAAAAGIFRLNGAQTVSIIPNIRFGAISDPTPPFITGTPTLAFTITRD